MSRAHEKAREFLECQKAFRLGELLTESSHPKTQRLSQTLATDLPAGIRLLQSVDDDIPTALERIFAQESFDRLVEALAGAIRTRHRIFFTGCGATGRLSILLEAAWRRFWREAAPERPDAARMRELCVSVMAGGDFALIKSVEGFEDFADFGRRQIKEAGVQRDDVVVAITEGGETSFVIGTAWQGLDVGAHVFFVYNNPTDLLCRHVQRSREVIEEPRIAKLDLTTGPMAITGSTRMQATTTELLIVGAALEMALAAEDKRWAPPTLQDSATEMALAKHVGCAVHTISSYRQLFETLLGQLSSPQAVASIARAVELEEQVYRRHGLVTYLADSLMLDVLTDTTERSPTFMTPPFRRAGDANSPASWAFVRNPRHPTEQAWREMLQREPRGLTWGPEVFRQLNAPAHIQSNPPKLDNAQIHKFRIGNEPDPSRTNAPDSLLVQVGDLSSHPSSIIRHQFRRTAAITFGPQAQAPGEEYATAFARGPAGICHAERSEASGPGTQPMSVFADEHIHVPCDVPDSPLRLWEHLAIKLILNTLSTATMVRMGRVIGNAMVWVSPSNKKLIDRGCRLIVLQTGCTYEHACEVLHEAIEELAERAQRGEEVPSPVAMAIERIQAGAKETP